MKRIFWLSLFGVIGLGLAAVAPQYSAAAEGASPAPVSAVGVVQQIQPEQGKVKIRHEPIPQLDWPAMTMFFRVRDKAALEGIAVGDKVRFDLEKDASGLVIVRMQKAAP